MMAIVKEVHTSDGVALRRIPVTLVRDGLRDGWLTYFDQARTQTGQLVPLEEVSGNARWPSATEAAQRRFRDWQWRFAYTWTACALVLLIPRATLRIENTFAFHDAPQWTSHPLFVVTCYALTLFAPRLLWGNRLAALGALIIGLNVTNDITRVSVGAIVEELNPIKLTLYALIASLTGYLVAIPFGIRKERAWLASKRVAIPGYVRDKYGSDGAPPRSAAQVPPAEG
jgi:hypothetical protein